MIIDASNASIIEVSDGKFLHEHVLNFGGLCPHCHEPVYSSAKHTEFAIDCMGSDVDCRVISASFVCPYCDTHYDVNFVSSPCDVPDPSCGVPSCRDITQATYRYICFGTPIVVAYIVEE